MPGFKSLLSLRTICTYAAVMECSPVPVM
jgi:hypothetical protein